MSNAGPPQGARIEEMDALDLIGRLVTNPHGIEYLVTHLGFDSRAASVIIWLVVMNEETGLPGEDESGVMDLNGWTIHQKLRRPR